MACKEFMGTNLLFFFPWAIISKHTLLEFPGQINAGMYEVNFSLWGIFLLKKCVWLMNK